MKKVIRLTESDLTRIVRRVINESTNETETKINTTFSDFPALIDILTQILFYSPGKFIDFVRAFLKLLFGDSEYNYEVYGFTAEDHGGHLTDKEIEKVKHLVFSYKSVTVEQFQNLIKELHKNRKQIIEKLKSFL